MSNSLCLSIKGIVLCVEKMDHIVTQQAVSVDNLLLATQAPRCVICSPNVSHLQAYDLLSTGGDNWQLQETGPLLNIADNGYHFVGDITSDGTVGAYVVTHLSEDLLRTSCLHIFDVNTMTPLGASVEIEHDRLTGNAQRAQVKKWKSVHRVCFSPDGERVAVIRSYDVEFTRSGPQMYMIFKRQPDGTLELEYDKRAVDIILESTMHWVAPDMLLWLQYSGLQMLIAQDGVQLEPQGWTDITLRSIIEFSLFAEGEPDKVAKGADFLEGGKVVPCAGNWYANVKLQLLNSETPKWYQVKCTPDLKIRLLPAEVDAETEQALLHLSPEQGRQYEIRGPLAIWGPLEGRCIIKRLDTIVDRLLAVAMATHPRLGQDSKISKDMMPFIQPHLIENIRPR